MTATELHFYMCSFCHSTATCTVRAPNTRIDCALCHRWMRFMWSEPIVTAEQQDLARQGLVHHPYDAPERKHHCGTCRVFLPRRQMINLAAAGWFCSQPCADEGAAKHERYLQRLAEEEAAQKRREQPWKYPVQQKESA